MEKPGRHNRVMRTIGFSCCLCFIYVAFYININTDISVLGTSFIRFDLFTTLLSCALTLWCIRAFPATMARLDASPAFLPICALIMIAGVASGLFGDFTGGAVLALVNGVCVGSPLAFIFTTWAKQFENEEPAAAAQEVLVATALAACVSVIASYFGIIGSTAIQCAVPALSVGLLMRLHAPEDNAKGQNQTTGEAGQKISRSVWFGTAVFGAAAGIMEIYVTITASTGARTLSISLVILFLFAIAAYQALTWHDENSNGNLSFLYRTVVMILVAGYLLTPLLEGSSAIGESIVLGGYLGLQATCMAIFIAIAAANKVSVASVFVLGFMSMHAGEAGGVFFANLMQSNAALFIGPAEFAALGGMLALMSFLYLFTEKTFDAYSEVVSETDDDGQIRATIEARYKLSNREADVLELALKGWTNERISQELFVSKSTADTHLRRIYQKMGIHSRQELYDCAERIRERS